jgi:hypothetical protein
MRVQNRRQKTASAAENEAAGRAGRALAAALAGAAITVAVGCALGPEQEPGCHHDAECGEGFTCRAGACFRTTTDRSSPATDAGDAAVSD